MQVVAKGMGLDGRIGRKFLHAGPGYGGSCFPKDTVALARTAEEKGVPMRLLESVIAVNAARKRTMTGRVVAACDGSVHCKTIAVLGLTFKPNTDDMRESVSLDVVPGLQRLGATVRAYDPAGMKEAKTLLQDVTWCKNPYEAAQGADVLVILTEWNEFRNPDFAVLKSKLKSPVVFDGRNIFEPEKMKELGFTYFGIGRKPVIASEDSRK